MVSGLYKQNDWFFYFDSDEEPKNSCTDGWRSYYTCLVESDKLLYPVNGYPGAKLLITYSLLTFNNNGDEE